MSYEQNPDQCLLSTPFSYRRSNPQLLWEFLFLLKASPSESRTPAPARLSPVTVTAKARAPAAQQQQSFFFFGPERGPAHPPATEASLNGVFCLPITHTRLQHAPVLQWASSPFLTPVHRTDREQTEERKKSCCWTLQHAAPSHRPRCGAACRRHSLPASNDRGKKGGGGRES